MAGAVPFSFRDLAAGPAEDGDAPSRREPVPVFSSSDVEAAFASGFEQGAAAAHAAGAAGREAEARAFADALAGIAAAFDEGRAEDRRRIRREGEAAIAILLRRTHGASAGEAALALIDRLLAASTDRSPATLRIGDAKLAALLADAIAARAAAEVIKIVVDDALPQGDFRLDWRGGVAERRFAALRAELRRLLREERAAAPEGGSTS